MASRINAARGSHVPARPSTGRLVLHWAGRVLIALEIAVLVLVVGVAGAVYGAYRGARKMLPSGTDIAGYRAPSASRIYASDGQLLAVVFDQDEGYRELVPLEAIPEHVREAHIAIEDRRFYQHQGVDMPRILRVAYQNYRSGRIEAGASTLTQQLARAIFLSARASYGRKAQEALLAIQIEREFSKDEILEMYLNQVCYGHPAYGIQAASRLYFDKDVGQLSVAEGALLAGIVWKPTEVSPWVNRDAALRRRSLVLAAMARDGYITQAEAKRADDEPLRLAPRRPSGLFSYRHPYFVTQAISELVQRYGPDAVYRSGLRVYTTMNEKVQSHCEEAIRRGVQRARYMNCTQAATVMMEPNTGRILAIVGGTGFGPSDQNNRATNALRQPGSSFKAFVYTAAIEKGYTPQTGISGSTVTIKAGPGEYWTVKSNGGSSLSLASALAASVNPASARLVAALGPSRVVEVAHRMGIRTELEPVYSIALGTEEVTLLEMTTAYCGFANGGYRVEPTTIDRVYDHDGVLLDEPAPRRVRAISMQTAYVMNGMLQGVVRHGTGTAASGLGVPTAGKTGTTDDNKDAWFVGLTPQIVCGVWAGNDARPMSGSAFGGRVCAPMFKDMVGYALDVIGKRKDLEFPGPGDERARAAIRFDSALFSGAQKEESKETKPLQRDLIDLTGGGGGGGRGGAVPRARALSPSVPSYVRTP
ncbi:MAG TPA: PBP1A family penicillin-binding protein [Armatimonadota bacterium]|nr:PBP1A family penicillin-binding protein [Armatimonadota bacterium]